MSDDRQDHEAKADELERELDRMQEQSDKLGGEIEDAGDEWERRKADESVPGAAGAPEEADGPEPEAEYPNKRGDGGDGDGEELDFGRALADESGDADSGESGSEDG
jgi:hypothetical protein